MNSNVRENVLMLMEERKKIEDEIEVYSLVLKKVSFIILNFLIFILYIFKNGVGMNDPLVDPDDFPLPNVDIYEVRDARQKIICMIYLLVTFF